MPVSERIFVEISSLYYGFNKSDDSSGYLSEKRKQIKIIADSLWEQSLENIFGSKPRNYSHAMQMINRQRGTLTAQEDIEVVNALHDVLVDYEVINDKNYIDIAEKLLPVFRGALKRLCAALASHSNHAGNLSAKKLIVILREV